MICKENSLKIHRCPHFCTPYIPPLTHSITMFSLVHSTILHTAYSQSDTACCVYMQLQTLDSNFNALLGCWVTGPPRPAGHLLSLPPWQSLHDSHHSAASTLHPGCLLLFPLPRTLGGGRRPILTELTCRVHCRPCSVDLIFITAALGAVMTRISATNMYYVTGADCSRFPGI